MALPYAEKSKIALIPGLRCWSHVPPPVSTYSDPAQMSCTVPDDPSQARGQRRMPCRHRHAAGVAIFLLTGWKLEVS
jgi:hypothetical protein